MLIPQLKYSTCKQLADERIKEATHLFSVKRYSGAYYLAGFSIELALKACYCKGVPKGSFPPEMDVYRDLYSHDLNKLLNASGLKSRFDLDRTAMLSGGTTLLAEWEVVKDWNVKVRYAKVKRLEADAMVQSTQSVLQWIKTLW